VRGQPLWRNRRHWLGLAALLVSAQITVARDPDPAPGASSAKSPCTPRDGLNFICGPVGSEDIVRIPGTAWLIASGLNLGEPAHLFLIDAQDKHASVLFPSRDTLMRPGEAATHCPGPPDLKRMSMDGLGLRAEQGGLHTLYAANHGDRLAIEMFRIDARASRPTATWVDCVLLPAGTLPNAVAPLPDGGMLVTSFYDPSDKSAWARMARAEITGRILRWDAKDGFRAVPHSDMSGANGLEISGDGRLVYASAWSARKLVILSLDGQDRHEITLDFMPDNVHHLEDGSLLVAGQRTQVQKIEACGGSPCPQPWMIAHVDPRTGTVQPLLSRAGSAEVNYACGAIRLGETIYFTARGSRSIAYVSADRLPSLQ
jgi:hypothetical protein